VETISGTALVKYTDILTGREAIPVGRCLHEKGLVSEMASDAVPSEWVAQSVLATSNGALGVIRQKPSASATLVNESLILPINSAGSARL
jgi:hypothetical protein